MLHFLQALLILMKMNPANNIDTISLRHNYHMHTARCGHASGEDRQYVEEAIRCGFDTIGFSDHTPYPFTNGYVSEIRMPCAALEGYVRSVLDLKSEYRSDIRILLGLEVEYYPELFSGWKNLTDAYPFDYFLLGQHYIENEYEGIWCSNETCDYGVLRRYVDQVIEAMQTGMFLYLAHPDLIRYKNTTSKEYCDEMKRLCIAAKEYGLPLEINLLGIWDKRWYPNENFWRIVGNVGNEVIIGSDAHSPAKEYPADALTKAAFMIRSNNLHWKQELL